MTAPLRDPIASVLICYSHADADLARALGGRLDDAGYRVWIDKGELRSGDSIVAAIAQAIDQVDFLVALISNHSTRSDWCQKELALALTGEIAQQCITVIPVRIGGTTMPPALKDKKYLSLDGDRLDASAAELIRDMQRHLEPPKPLPPRRRAPGPSTATGRTTQTVQPKASAIPTYKIIGIDLDRLGKPRNDGTRGSALHEVPFNLDGTPDGDWSRMLEHNWNHPPRWTTMHRPRIASVHGSTIVLDRTTMDEVRRYHLETLKLAVEETNKQYVASHEQKRARQAVAERVERQRLEDARRIVDGLDFD